MTETNKLKKLAQTLKDCSDTSTDPLKVVSNILDTNILDKLEIRYENQAEGIYIDLSGQAYNIYKNKQDALLYFVDSSKSSLIIENELIYIADYEVPSFFENLIYSQKIQELMYEKKIISYRDGASKKYIFLSEQIGKVEVEYKQKSIRFLNGEYDLSNLYTKLELKFTETEYLGFFRDNFLKKVNEINNINSRFYEALIDIHSIFENANREFELYKNKFSFDQFHSDLKKEKEKYIKNIQENLSEFLSKVNALPVQFGVYILLVFRFQDEIIPLFATVILIVSWSAFSFFSLTTMRKTINFLERKFKYVFEKISEESGIDEDVLVQDKQEVENKISDIKNMICWYKWVVVIFSLIFIAFSGSNIYKELNQINIEKVTSINKVVKDTNDSLGLAENNQTFKNTNKSSK